MMTLVLNYGLTLPISVYTTFSSQVTMEYNMVGDPQFPIQETDVLVTFLFIFV
jgi:hypothetical protein